MSEVGRIVPIDPGPYVMGHSRRWTLRIEEVRDWILLKQEADGKFSLPPTPIPAMRGAGREERILLQADIKPGGDLAVLMNFIKTWGEDDEQITTRVSR